MRKMEMAVLASVLAGLLLLAALPASASAGLAGWQYQREIAIQENSGETLRDYQVLVELSGNEFPEEAQADGDDIRFTDADGRELSYWIEEFDAGSKRAAIWVKVPLIHANGEAMITMWYGNPGAVSESDGEAVFEFFDDFNANTIGIKWYQDAGAGATIDTSGTGYAKIPQVSGNVLSTKRTFSRPFVAETKVKTDITSRYMAGIAFYDMGTDINKRSYHAFYDSSSINVRYGGSSYTDHTGDAFTPNTGIYYKLVLVLNSNQVISKVYSGDGTNIGQRSISDTDWDDKNLEIDSFGSSSSHFGWFDWFYVRKYASPEPTVTISHPTLATHTALTITKSPAPHSIRQFQETVITIAIENSGTTDATDIEITDAIHPSFDLTSGDFPNPKRYDQIRPGETRDLQYTIRAMESGTFTLDPATVTYADEDGNIQEVKSEPASIKVILSTEGSTSGGTSRSNPSVSTASVQLHGEKTNVVLGEDILLKLSAVNLITKPTMHVQVIIIPPSGMSVTSSAFAKSGAGQYTTTYELEPGTGKDIEVAIRSNQVGEFDVNGRIIYYFGDDRDDAEDHTLTLPITVRAEAEPGADQTESQSESKGSSTPGFGAVVAVIGVLLVALLIKRRRLR